MVKAAGLRFRVQGSEGLGGRPARHESPPCACGKIRMGASLGVRAHEQRQKRPQTEQCERQPT